MDMAFDGICELVLQSRVAAAMTEFYERPGLSRPADEGERVWLSAGAHCRIGIWSPGEKEHRDREGSHVGLTPPIGFGREIPEAGGESPLVPRPRRGA